ncbi:MAG: hypothetical protein NW217_15415 [Hyphomicrobiaceae bacterium]|nr:hypothetical protein [Hyphomicrobiaceae bacterium]
MAREVAQELHELNVRIEEIEDPRESYALVKDCIRRRKDAGEEVPEALSMLERSLLVDCLSASQGR